MMRPPSSKIVPQRTLASFVKVLRRSDLKIVTTNGTYDMCHHGHARGLEWSRDQGDILIVGINSDRSVRAYKGKDRPIVGQDDRAFQVASLECVDLVTILDEDEIGGALLRLVHPDIHTTGANWRDGVPEQDVIDELGIKLLYVPIFDAMSTTELLSRVKDVA